MVLLRLEPLEDRIVLDGAIAHDVAALTSHAVAASATHGVDLHVLVVSNKTPDLNVLASAAQSDVKVVVYDFDSDNLNALSHEINVALRGQKAESIGFVTSGSAGQVDLLNNLSVNNETIQSPTMKNFWNSVGSDLQPSGSVDIFGCNVASTSAGATLVNAIGSLVNVGGSHLSVNASTDLTGSSSLGGNWTLEYSSSGAYSSSINLIDDNAGATYFNMSQLRNWDHVLGATILSTSGGGSYAIEGGAAVYQDFYLSDAPADGGTVVYDITENGGDSLYVVQKELVFTSTNYSTPQPVEFAAIADTLGQGDKSYQVTLSIDKTLTTASNYINAPDLPISITAVDPSLPATLSVNSTTTTDGPGFSTDPNLPPYVQAFFSVTLSVPEASPVTVNYSTVDGTAKAGVDYIAASGSITFDPGQTLELISVNIVRNPLPISNLTFGVTLSDIQGNAMFGIASAAGTIVNYNPNPPGVKISSHPNGLTTSDDTDASFTVALTDQPTSDVTVVLTKTNSNQGAFNTLNGPSTDTLTFTPYDWLIPQVVTVVGGATASSAGNPEVVSVQSVSSSDPNWNGLHSSQTVSITNNGVVSSFTPSFTISDPTVVQGGVGSLNPENFTITLNPGSAANGTVFSVKLALNNLVSQIGNGDLVNSITGTNVSGSTLTIVVGTDSLTQTVTVYVNGAAFYDLDEHFAVEMYNPSSTGSTQPVFLQSQGLATIVDNNPPPSLAIDFGFPQGGGNSGNNFQTVSFIAQDLSYLYYGYDVTLTSGTGIINQDSPAETFSVILAPGQHLGSYPVFSIPNDIYGSNKTINSTITNFFASGPNTNQPSVSFTLINNNPVPSYYVTDVSGSDSNSPFQFVVGLTNVSSATPSGQSVTAVTADNTAVAGTDYDATGPVTFTFNSATALQQIFSVPIIQEGGIVTSKSFYVELSDPNPSSGGVAYTIADPQGVGTIFYTGEDITVDDATVAVGGVLDFTVSLSDPSTQTITVDYATADNTAVAGQDYAALGTTLLTFLPGETTKTVEVTTLNNMVYEANPTLYLNLSNPTNGIITRSQAVGTIVETSNLPTISINNVAVNEGQTAVFQVVIHGETKVPIDFTVNTSDGTAKQGTDYEGISNLAVQLPANYGLSSSAVSISVNTIYNGLVEPNLNYFVNLSNVSNVAASGNTLTGEGTIVKLNSPSPNLTVTMTSTDMTNSESVFNGDVIQYNINVSNNSSDAATDVIVTDQIPYYTNFIAGSLVVSSPSYAQFTQSTNTSGLPGGGGFVTFTLGAGATTTTGGEIDPGQSISMSFSVQVTQAGAGQTITNTANTTFNDAYNNPKTPVQTSAPPLVVDQEPQVTVEETSQDIDGVDTYPGDIIEYTIVVINNSTSIAQNVVLTDMIVNTSTYLSGTLTIDGMSKTDAIDNDQAEFVNVDNQNPSYGLLTFRLGTNASDLAGGTLAYNQKTTITFEVMVNSTDAPETFIQNSATVSYKDTSGNSFNDTGSDMNPLEVSQIVNPSLTIANVAVDLSNQNGEVFNGDTIQYTITIINNSQTAAMDVVVTDQIPDYTTYVPGSLLIDNMAPTNQTAEFTSAPNPDGHPGGEGSVTFRVGSGADGSNGGEIDSNGKVTVSFSVTIGSAGVDQGITNSAVTTFEGPNSLASSVTTPSNTLTVNSEPILSIQDVSQDINGGDTLPGDILLYTITVANNSSTLASDIVLRDFLPNDVVYVAGSGSGFVQTVTNGNLTNLIFNIGNDPSASAGGFLAPTQKSTVTFEVMINSPESAGTTISNSAQVTLKDSSGNPLSYTNGDLTPPVVAPQPVLTIQVVSTDTTDSTETFPGDTIEYLISAKNNTSSTAENIILSDLLSDDVTYVAGSLSGDGQGQYNSGSNSITFNVGSGATSTMGGSLAPGAEADVMFDVTINSTTRLGTPIQAGTKIINLEHFDFTNTSDFSLDQNGQDLNPPIISPEPSLVVVITSQDTSGSDAFPGDTLQYTINILNNSPSDAQNISLTDMIPQGTTYVSGSASGGEQVTYDSTTGSVNFELGSLNGNSRASPLTFDVVITGSPNTVINDSATASYRDHSGNGLSSTGSDFHPPTIASAPILSVNESSVDLTDSNETLPGDLIKYSINIENNSGSTAQDIILNDPIPMDTTYLPGSLSIDGFGKSDQSGDDEAEYNMTTNSITFRLGDNANMTVGGSLAPGFFTTVTFEVTINPGTIANTTIRNVPTVSFTNTSSSAQYTAFGTDNDPPVVDAEPALTVTVSSQDINGGDTLPGDILLYTIEVINNSDSRANDIILNDMIPMGTTYVANSLSIDGNSQSDAADKDEAEYTPTGNGLVTFRLGSGANGSMGGFLDHDGHTTATFEVMITASAGTGINNTTAVATYNDDSGNPLTTTGTNILPPTVSQEPTLTVTESTQDLVDSQEVLPNDLIEYTITVTNNSTSTAQDVILTDMIPHYTIYMPNTLSIDGMAQTDAADSDNAEITNGNSLITFRLGSNPSGGMGGTLAPQGTTTITFEVTIDPHATVNTMISNNPQISFVNTSNSSSQSFTLQDPHALTVGSEPQLNVSISSQDQTGTDILTGDTLLYTIDVINPSGGTANNVVLNDPIPEGTTYVMGSLSGGISSTYDSATNSVTFQLGTIAAHTSDTGLMFEVVINAPTNTTIANTATATFNDNSNHSLMTSGSDLPFPIVAAEPVLTLSVSSQDLTDPNETLPGDTIEYSMTIMNSSSTTANSVVLTDMIQMNTTFVAGSLSPSADSSYNAGSNSVIFMGGSLTPGTSETFTFEVTINAGTSPTTEINTFPSVNYTDTSNHPQPTVTAMDPNPLFVDPEPSLVITITSKDINGQDILPGDTLLYTIHVTNDSTSTANNINLSDMIPGGTSYIGESASGGISSAYDNANETLTFQLGNLTGNTSVMVTFEVTITASPGTKINDSATATYTDDSNNSFTASGSTIQTLTVDPEPMLEITIRSVDLTDSIQTLPGDIIKYSINVTNESSSTAANIILTDLIPESTTYVQGTLSIDGFGQSDAPLDDQAEYVSSGNGSVTFRLGSLDPGLSATAVYEVRINFGTSADTKIVDMPSLSFTDTSGNQQQTLAGLDPNPLNVDPEPLLTIVQSSTDVNGNDTLPGDIIQYTITVTNNSASPALDVILNDVIPAGSVYYPNSLSIDGMAQRGSSEADFDSATNSVIFRLGTGANTQVGGSLVYRQHTTAVFEVMIDPNAQAGDEIDNTAQVVFKDNSSKTFEITNIDSTAPAVSPEPMLTITESSVDETDSLETLPNDIIQYTILVSNPDTSTAENIILDDPIPGHTTYVINSLLINGNTPSSGETEFDSATNSLIIRLGRNATTTMGGAFNQNDNATIVFDVKINPQTQAETKIVNTPIVNYTDTSNHLQLSASATDPNVPIVDPEPQLQVVTSSKDLTNPDQILPGDTIEYTVVVTNVSNRSIAKNVFFNDMIPADTNYLPGSLIINGNPQTNDLNEFNGNLLVLRLGQEVGGNSVFLPGSTETIQFDVMIRMGVFRGSFIHNAISVVFEDNSNNPQPIESVIESIQVTPFNVTFTRPFNDNSNDENPPSLYQGPIIVADIPEITSINDEIPPLNKLIQMETFNDNEDEFMNYTFLSNDESSAEDDVPLDEAQIPKIVVSEFYNTNEGNQGLDGFFLVSINVKPTSNVVIDFEVKGIPQTDLNPAVLVFTPDNWNITQLVEVTDPNWNPEESAEIITDLVKTGDVYNVNDTPNPIIIQTTSQQLKH